MKPILKIAAIIGLLLSAGAPLLTFLGAIDVELDKTILFIGMIVWFVSAPLVMKRVS